MNSNLKSEDIASKKNLKKFYDKSYADPQAVTRMSKPNK